MLPFLKPKRITSVLVKKADGGPVEPEAKESDALVSIAEELIQSIHMKDANAVSSALKAAFELCSMDMDEPSEGEEGLPVGDTD